MTPEGWRWIRKSVVSITGVEIWAACWASAVIRSAGASRSTCRVCWLSMLQCCVNSILQLITFFAIGRWRLAGRWPRQCSVRSPVWIRYHWHWGVTLAFNGIPRGCGVRGWAMFLQLTRPPIFTWKDCWEQCIRQSLQIINNCLLFLDPQACTSNLAYHQPQKCFSVLGKCLPLICPSLHTAASAFEVLHLNI